jgi:hypothetical protein
MTEQVPSKMTDAEWVELVSAMGGPKTEQRPSKEWMPSPKRYFLNAPKEEPGTCFVKNDDYAELWRRYEALRRERDTSATVAGRALTELHEKVTAHEPESAPVAWQYRVNGVHVFYTECEPPPDDAYDEGTLQPLYARPAQPPPAEQAQWKWKCERCKSLVSILAGGCESCGAPRPVPASAPGAG